MASTSERAAGTRDTREFYDEVGWSERDGKTVDAELFGVKEDGRIKKELHRTHMARVRAALATAGTRLNLLECGCGGNPESAIFDLCRHYTGTDFSRTGLELATRKLAGSGVPHVLKQADICDLPFPDASFDAVYSAHVIYHIDKPSSQRAALGEMMRVLRPNGVLVLICANPRPLLSPMRLARRVIVDAPVVGSVIAKLRPKPPLPYRPMRLRWMKRELRHWGEVRTQLYALPSIAFHQRVSEDHSAGRLLWKTVRWLDLHMPELGVYLGNYVLFRVTRR